MIKDSWHALLSRPMDRREFLITLGVGFLALSGIAGLLAALIDPAPFTRAPRPTAGFGSGSYGGKERA